MVIKYALFLLIFLCASSPLLSLINVEDLPPSDQENAKKREFEEKRKVCKPEAF
jgi:hypothetical protein